MDYLPGDDVEYEGKTVGQIRSFGEYIVMQWSQAPLRKLSDEYRTRFGMSVGLKEQIEESNIDYIEIKNATIPVSVLDSYDTLSQNDSFFNEPRSEDQILIEIPQ